MPKKKEDKDLSAKPSPQATERDARGYAIIDEEFLRRIARPAKSNEKGEILLDKNDPLDRLWYGDEE